MLGVHREVCAEFYFGAYLKPKANFFMKMSLCNNPSNLDVTVLSSAENVLFNSRIQIMTDNHFIWVQEMPPCYERSEVLALLHLV
jgi:hypothetical protein